MRRLIGGSGSLIPLDEREALGNSLAEMAESYTEGWDGRDDSEEEDDDDL